MKHKGYIREVAGSRTAVLMLHGIAGTPAHFRDLIPVIPGHWAIYNILLDGHGKEVGDFSRTSMKKWKAQVAATLDMLFARYDAVFIVAHSMGTLFAIQAGIDHPDRVCGLFLQAVPLRVHLPVSTILTSLRATRKQVSPDDTAVQAMTGDCSIRLTPNLFKYIGWAPRFLELLWEIRRVRSLIPRLHVPCHAFQSRKDELVSPRACGELAKNPTIQVTLLHGSGHFAYSPEDTAVQQAALANMLVQH